MVGLNCAVCHVGTLRASKDAPRQIIAGMPANQFNLQAYLNFLRNIANDKRFNADTLIPAIKKADPRLLAAPTSCSTATTSSRARRRRCASCDDDFKWMDVRPTEGPGRVDTFNPYKVIVGISTGDTGRHLGPAVDLEPAPARGDAPALGRQQRQRRRAQHQRGDRRRRAARDSLDEPALKRDRATGSWTSRRPRYPRERIDQRARGRGARGSGPRTARRATPSRASSSAR